MMLMLMMMMTMTKETCLPRAGAPNYSFILITLVILNLQFLNLQRCSKRKIDLNFVLIFLLYLSLPKQNPSVWALHLRPSGLAALAVHDARAALVVLFPLDPHLLERLERREDRSSNPDRVLALGRGDDLDLHSGRRERGELLLHTLVDVLEHSGSAGHHHVLVEAPADVNVTRENRLEGQLVYALALLADEAGLEQDLGAPEALRADGDNAPVGQLVVLLDLTRLLSFDQLLVVVHSDVCQLLLDVPYDLALSTRRVGLSTLGQNLHQVISQVAPC